MRELPGKGTGGRVCVGVGNPRGGWGCGVGIPVPPTKVKVVVGSMAGEDSPRHVELREMVRASRAVRRPRHHH